MTTARHGMIVAMMLAALLAALCPPALAAQSGPDRGEGIQVWTSQPPIELTAFATPPADSELGIKLVGIRNARFAGRIVLASAKPIRGVKVNVTDLAADGGAAISAKDVAVRFALPGVRMPRNRYVPEFQFNALVDRAPAEMPTRVLAVNFRRHAPRRPAGAMLPVWVTVNVPADAKPGTYSGKVTVEAEGLAATDVPLSIRVHAWTMPEPKDYTCRNNIWQSHESSALHYKVPFWSDKHFKLMGKVLELTRRMGNGFCDIHLIASAYHQGNSQSMVRWIKKGENKYDHDFTIFDKYLDLYEKALGKPNVLLLTVYTPYVVAKGRDGKLRGATVSLLDPATGKVEGLHTPDYGTPESVAFWKPVLDEAFKRIAKRGWMDTVVVGTSSDPGPKTPEVYDMLKQIWPGCRVMFSGHPRRWRFTTSKKVIIPVTCGEQVWNAGRLRKHYPWPVVARPASGTFAFSRAGAGMCHLWQNDLLCAYRANPEMCLQCGQNGIGRVGADFWLPPGRSALLCGRTGAHLGQAASITAFTAPTSDGPVTTKRLEMFVEGMQVREALGFLLGALAAKKLDPALAAKCRKYLDDRAASHLKYRPKKYNREHGMPYEPNWQEQEDRLFALCAEASGGK